MVEVVYCLDDGFAACTAVSIFSLLSATSSPVRLTVVDCGLGGASKATLHAVADLFDHAAIRFVPAPAAIMEDERVAAGIRATLSRLHLPWMLDGRLIYLDGDTLVRADVARLAAVDLAGKAAGAVPCFRTVARRHTAHSSLGRLAPTYRKALGRMAWVSDETGLSDARRYVNAGVLVMECEALRTRATALADHRAAMASRILDETWINRVLRDELHLLDPEWNVFANAGRSSRLLFPPEDRRRYAAALRQPSIVHFVGRRKPWRPLSAAAFLGGVVWRQEWLRTSARMCARLRDAVGVS